MKSIDYFMNLGGFKPNDAQRKAILHGNGPLYLPAGPGSGKTRVLLWRVFNLIVYRGIDPAKIFLSTFTEKAARQLESGLFSLLVLAQEELGRPFDTTELYVGTLHSLSNRILADRRFLVSGTRPRPPVLMDQLSQFLYLYRGDGNRALLTYARNQLGLADPNDFYLRVQSCFVREPKYPSRFDATNLVVDFFNRVSEEASILEDWQSKAEALGLSAYHEGIRLLLDLYAVYLQSLHSVRKVDLSLVQSEALAAVVGCPEGGSVFDEVVIDEYQDTNAVQERLVFALASGKKNICVVGDDDQALYRFRGATVENFVRFPDRVRERWGIGTETIPVVRNYRSRGDIVAFYGRAIVAENWEAPGDAPPYRVAKEIKAHRGNDGPAVFTSSRRPLEEAADEAAILVEKLIASGKVDDPNRIAFLFPSVTSNAPKAYIAALEARGIKAYAPRAGSFLNTNEALVTFGFIGKTIGFGRSGFMNEAYKAWTHDAETAATKAIENEPALELFIEDRRKELEQSAKDYAALAALVAQRGWSLDQAYDRHSMKAILSATPGISPKAKRSILSRYFDTLADKALADGKPYKLDYVLTRAAGLDWSLLDHFYRLTAFKPLKDAFDLAEGLAGAVDEGPICNLSLVSGYIARYCEEYGELIGPKLADGGLERLFFGSYLSILWKLGQSEYEDPEYPFPRGRVPFLTIHQSKGLEFPVVFVPNTVRRARPRICEELIEPFLAAEREPKDRRADFDEARRFYVAFSRAENLLVIPRSPKYVGKQTEPLLGSTADLASLSMDSIPIAKAPGDDLPRNYSYTGDYTFYGQCPRRYMAFRTYGFSASRTQNAVFGILVHRTIEDLHRKLIEKRGASHA
jgi:DNA helicase-2/ATP-dependent DNA helicase PcrA